MRCDRPFPPGLDSEDATAQGWRALRTDAGNIAGVMCSSCLAEEQEPGTVLGADEWQRFYDQTE
jgi:hypothetical protein